MSTRMAWIIPAIAMALHGARAQETASVERSDVVPDTFSVLARPVTTRLSSLPLRRAIDAVAAAAHVRIAYTPEAVNAPGKVVTLEANGESLRTVMASVLEGTTLQLVPVGGTQLMIVNRTGQAVGDSATLTGTIQGTVIDSANGKVIPGATIAVVGTKMRAVSTDAGKFVLRSVPIGERVVTIKVFGYHPDSRSVTVANDILANIRVVLTRAPTMLSGVVTTATGVQRKIEVGNDIATINVDSVMHTAPIRTVTDLLETRVPGLTVVRSSGNPGDPARIRLRGPKSVNGSNDPIVVVDGVRVYGAQTEARSSNTGYAKTAGLLSAQSGSAPIHYNAPSPLDQIDPNSIETIEVFKGPSASALYGSDAANGVIVITTKKGRSGAMRWSGSVAQGIDYLPGDYPMQYARWAHAYDQPSVQCDWAHYSDCPYTDSTRAIQIANLSRFSPFTHGNASSGSVTLSGGVSQIQYALTGSASRQLGNLKLPDALVDAYQDVRGTAPPSWAKRPARYSTWGGTGSMTADPSATLHLQFQTSLFHSDQRHSSLESSISVLIGTVDTVNLPFNIDPYERAMSTQLTSTYAMTASWRPWQWLPLTGTVGINTVAGRDEVMEPSFTSLDVSTDTVGHFSVGTKNSLVRTLNVNTAIDSWNTRVRTTLGVNVTSQSTNDLMALVDSLAQGVTAPSSGLTSGSQSITGAATYGWFLEPRLNLSSRFFAAPGFRLDGGNANGGRASVSGLPSRLTFASLFPKIDFSWIAVDRQSEAPLFGALTQLRPRLSIGSAGVQPDVGDRLRLLYAGSTVHDLYVQTLGNTLLRPERSQELEGGFDAELWHGRASAVVTMARQVRHDAIIDIPVAPSVRPSAAATGIKTNIGEIQNGSVELSGTVTPIQRQAFGWTMSGNWAHVTNKVMRLDRAGDSLPAGFGTKIAVGYPLFGRWERPIVSYADDNHDGILSASEIRLGDTTVYMGVQDPATTAQFTNDLTLFGGRLGIHATFAYQGDYVQVDRAWRQPATALSIANTDGADLSQQAAYVAASGNFVETQSLIGLIQTIHAWRFNTFSLNYTLPGLIARRLGGRRASVALQGSNLALWTNYRGKDPNVNALTGSNLTADFGQNPQARSWQLQFTIGND